MYDWILITSKARKFFNLYLNNGLDKKLQLTYLISQIPFGSLNKSSEFTEIVVSKLTSLVKSTNSMFVFSSFSTFSLTASTFLMSSLTSNFRFSSFSALASLFSAVDKTRLLQITLPVLVTKNCVCCIITTGKIGQGMQTSKSKKNYCLTINIHSDALHWIGLN